jgi:hypothetical protein
MYALHPLGNFGSAGVGHFGMILPHVLSCHCLLILVQARLRITRSTVTARTHAAGISIATATSAKAVRE